MNICENCGSISYNEIYCSNPELCIEVTISKAKEEELERWASSPREFPELTQKAKEYLAKLRK